VPEPIRQGDIPGVQLRRRQGLPVAPEEAWRWLVEPERLARWLAREAEVSEAGLQLQGTGAAGEPEPSPWREQGRTLERVPPTLWVLAFERLDAGWPAATRLTLRIHRTAAGSEVDVLQDGFQHLPLSICLTVWEAYRHRWRDALARLASALTP
jgi:uncharacterized protein YndB with AHSA1/START domain